MYNRLRSSIRDKTGLQAKHIKKFKFRGSETTEGAAVILSKKIVNKQITNENSSGTRKRKMTSANESTLSLLSKVKNLFCIFWFIFELQIVFFYCYNIQFYPIPLQIWLARYK